MITVLNYKTENKRSTQNTEPRTEVEQKALLYSTKKLLRLALRVVLSFMCKYYLMMLSSGLHIYSEWLDHFCDAADFLRNAQASGGL